MRKLLLLLYSLFAINSSLFANWVKVAEKAKKAFVVIDVITMTEVTISTYGVSRVDYADNFGSGVFINNKGLILTCSHVFWTDGRVIETNVLLPNGQTVIGKLVAISTSSDLALIQVDTKSKYLKLGRIGSVRAGQKAMSVGNPAELMRSVSVGVIASAVRWYMGGYYTQFDGITHNGCSGGPLLDSKGRIIGVLSRMKMSDFGPIQGLAFAVPLEEIHAFVQEHNER